MQGTESCTAVCETTLVLTKLANKNTLGAKKTRLTLHTDRICGVRRQKGIKIGLCGWA